jgi:hypothetical protein
MPSTRSTDNAAARQAAVLDVEDRGQRQVEHRAEERAEHQALRQHLGVAETVALLQIRAHAVGLLPGRAQHRGAQAPIGGEFAHPRGQLLGERRADGVERFGPVQDDFGDRSLAAHFDHCHGSMVTPAVRRKYDAQPPGDT